MQLAQSRDEVDRGGGVGWLGGQVFIGSQESLERQLGVTRVDLLALLEQIGVRREQRVDGLRQHRFGQGLALLALRGELPALRGQAAALPVAMVLQRQLDRLGARAGQRQAASLAQAQRSRRATGKARAKLNKINDLRLCRSSKVVR